MGRGLEQIITFSSGTGLCPGSSCLLSAFGPISETVGGVVAMFLSAVTCKWGWRRRQGLRQGREAVTGRLRDGAGLRARAGREPAAATCQAFRTTASGMLRGTPPWGLEVSSASSSSLCGRRDGRVWSAGIGCFPGPS